MPHSISARPYVRSEGQGSHFSASSHTETQLELERHIKLNSGNPRQPLCDKQMNTNSSQAQTLLSVADVTSTTGTFCPRPLRLVLPASLSTSGPISEPSLSPWSGGGLLRAICVSRPPSLSWSKHGRRWAADGCSPARLAPEPAAGE